MKRLLYLLVFITMGTVVCGQDNLKVDRFLIVNVENMKNTELETHVVPESEVWSIESVFTHFETHSVSIIIDEEKYHIPFGEVRRSVCLPFYLPSGTKFQLGTEEGPAILSIKISKLE